MEKLARVWLSGLPVQKVAVQVQACIGAFFGVKLGGKEVVAGDCGSKPVAIVGQAYAVRGVGGAGVVAVQEVKPAFIGQALPHGVGLALAHAVPAHLRDFVAAAVGLGLLF